MTKHIRMPVTGVRSFAAPLCSAAAVLLALVCAAPAAQPYITRPVRIIVPFPPGGGVDIVARLMAPRLSETYGQQVVVDNRPGAAGVIGTELAARSAPDGHTWLLATLGNLAVNRHLYSKMAVDPLRDLAPVTQVVAVHFVMVAHPSLPAKNVKTLIALAAARPGEITYASSGAGGAPHLAGALFNSMAKVRLSHIPYKGSGPSFVDLLGGQVSLTFDSLLQALPYVRAGKLNALAVLGPTRAPQLPAVPTVAESGLPGYELTNWFGLAVPAAMPRELVQRIHGDVTRVLERREVRERLVEMGADVIADTPQQFGAFIASESAKWARVIREAGIRAE
jgi:tripartite-type tricarboxylate transporter receptor subunit TctC